MINLAYCGLDSETHVCSASKSELVGVTNGNIRTLRMADGIKSPIPDPFSSEDMKALRRADRGVISYRDTHTPLKFVIKMEPQVEADPEDPEREECTNRCIECSVDMGRCNPRQYCGKTHCLDPPDSS
tara:strand:- start:96 stop:479 length:384 start_codon:yes stop_codon:yes gene_type:complete